MRNFIKKIIPANSALFKFLSKKYKSLFKIWLPPRRSLDSILKQYSALHSTVFFIQIGSNDGISNDPIHKYIINNNWNGILVEPVKSLFDKLRSNYDKNSGILSFENAAISKNDGTAIFYRLRESNNPATPAWYNQIGSFNKQVLLSHKDSDEFESMILEEEINTISFGSLIKKYTINKVDLVHIDTEGFDYEILKLIDFKKLDVGVVIYEYVHLSITDFVKSLQLMKSNGFKVFASNLDIVCLKNSIKIS